MVNQRLVVWTVARVLTIGGGGSARRKMLKISTVLRGYVVKEAEGVALLLLNLDTGCYGLDGPGFETLQGQEIFLY